MQPIEILNKYWGHTEFRPLQEDIINSVLAGKDTLAILPTGGGKSICFQIPGIMLEGLTLVVSPLIALMNDQVENLKKRNISAIAFHSGLTRKETEIEYSNIRYGKYKFVYVSPERIKTERFKEIIAETPVTLLAVDEAHCISQWGYDFRPEYLLIAELRAIFKKTPCIALTASATPLVQKDIYKFLKFDDKVPAFRQTIVRPNLNYAVVEDENKNDKLIKITSKLNGSGIVYVKNRKSAVFLSAFLNKNDVIADFYHAGIDLEQRNLKQLSWQKGFTRVIVCTNAFGMGIDKNNVRFVVHYDIPESPEAYYQEAGRAGRDGVESWCILLYCIPDKIATENNLLSKYLEKKQIQAIFNAICNYFQIPYGGGFEETYELDLSALSTQYNFTVQEIQTALGMMQKDGLVKLSDAFANPSKLMIIASNSDLYKFYLVNGSYELFIKTILRMYGGIFDNYIQISEFEIAKNLKIPVDKVKSGLDRLTKMRLFDYIPQNEKPVMTMLMPRPEIIPHDRALWKFLKENAHDRLNAIFNYAETKECRQKKLAMYFGENELFECGKCDQCRSRKKSLGNNVELVRNILQTSFSHEYHTFETIVEFIGEDENNMDALRFLMDTGKFKVNKQGLYKWNEQEKK